MHGGAGGIGTFAIQLASALGARVLTTAGTPEKLAAVRDARRRRRRSTTASRTSSRWCSEATDGARRRRHPRQHGREVPRPQRRRARHRGPAGHHRHAGRHQGRARHRRAAAQARRGHRDHPAGPPGRGEGGDLRASVVEHVWPLVADGSVRPIVHSTLPLEEAAAAHALMESGEQHRQDPADHCELTRVACSAPPRLRPMSEQQAGRRAAGRGHRPRRPAGRHGPGERPSAGRRHAAE